MGYVYKITNTVNGKSYIGISIHEPTQGRIKTHLSGRGNQEMVDDLKAYGKDAFTYEVLEANVFDEFLPDLEVAYIAQFNTVAPHGYNLDSGGSHKIPSEESRRKNSESHKGKKHSAETRRRMSEIRKGKTLSEETRRKISEANKNRSEEHQRKISESLKGKTPSEETRRKISESLKGTPVSADTRRKLSEAHKGKPKSMEHRRKLSEAHKGKPKSMEHRRKMSESKKGNKNALHPNHSDAHNFFFSFPPSMPLSMKRKLLYDRFPNVRKERIREWVRKWSS